MDQRHAPIQRPGHTRNLCDPWPTVCQRQLGAQTWLKKPQHPASGALAEGETAALLRTATQLARAGNVPMLKFLLGRFLPRDRLVKLDLPQMVFADDGVEALGSIMRAVSEGEITPSEGAALATIVKSYTDAIDMADVVKRMDVLEAKLKAVTQHDAG